MRVLMLSIALLCLVITTVGATSFRLSDGTLQRRGAGGLDVAPLLDHAEGLFGSSSAGHLGRHVRLQVDASGLAQVPHLNGLEMPKLDLRSAQRWQDQAQNPVNHQDLHQGALEHFRFNVQAARDNHELLLQKQRDQPLPTRTFNGGEMRRNVRQSQQNIDRLDNLVLAHQQKVDHFAIPRPVPGTYGSHALPPMSGSERAAFERFRDNGDHVRGHGVVSLAGKRRAQELAPEIRQMELRLKDPQNSQPAKQNELQVELKAQGEARGLRAAGYKPRGRRGRRKRRHA